MEPAETAPKMAPRESRPVKELCRVMESAQLPAASQEPNLFLNVVLLNCQVSTRTKHSVNSQTCKAADQVHTSTPPSELPQPKMTPARLWKRHSTSAAWFDDMVVVVVDDGDEDEDERKKERVRTVLVVYLRSALFGAYEL
jgi:hypothetical protein